MSKFDNVYDEIKMETLVYMTPIPYQNLVLPFGEYISPNIQNAVIDHVRVPSSIYLLKRITIWELKQNKSTSVVQTTKSMIHTLKLWLKETSKYVRF